MAIIAEQNRASAFRVNSKEAAALGRLAASLCVVAGSLVAGLLLLFLFAAGDDEVVLVVPGQGRFRGLKERVDDGLVYVFRGIRFAQNTAGERRFSRSFGTYLTSDGWYDARAPKPGCAQGAFKIDGKVVRQNNDTTEDCLHLNVWTPCTRDSDPDCSLTVLVFFDSRGFQSGDNNLYDGRWMAGLGRLVVVAPNFRLGVFGFLNLGKSSAQNYSVTISLPPQISFQVHVLRWSRSTTKPPKR
ncbi:hypothetical protein HPB48_008932 [Haemaphysalis longicornis]|uniref:Carboxylesterase type B domain-containing protein n=1 Tax=Haemaphysalis longicornis TaxID=44386 RepID=A0A9J6H6A4_HAELO|nr:hypothetical protein HPB48_008932 [Haemaphysalis longicornis]